jgi:hypothetical protein
VEQGAADDPQVIGRRRKITMTTTDTAFDPASAEAFGGHIMGILKGGLLSMMADIGHRTGLFADAAAG